MSGRSSSGGGLEIVFLTWDPTGFLVIIGDGDFGGLGGGLSNMVLRNPGIDSRVGYGGENGGDTGNDDRLVELTDFLLTPFSLMGTKGDELFVLIGGGRCCAPDNSQSSALLT